MLSVVFPPTSGTRAVLRRWEMPPKNPLSESRQVIALRGTFYFASCPHQTPQERTFLCSEAVMSLLEGKTEKRKSLISELCSERAADLSAN